MIGRIRRALAAGRQAVDAATGTVPAPQAALALLALDPIGPGAADLRARHLEAARLAGARALFVLSPLSAPDLAAQRLLCEILPLPEDLARATGDGPLCIAQYRLNRLRLILDKWGVQACHWSGESAAELVDEWQAARDPGLRPIRFRPAP
ncbi:hypothetical protein [Rhodovulum strictum]|uniref:Uncharacterized protein n=1 Tax=Rhodovulum strictum TaxID=58314 RepID=A0A844BH00_9RHOB|nr:hypothetical protein [Rhodovulum strictum]MRH20715.1 hypothetical protein [Rhodovulum strictum]